LGTKRAPRAQGTSVYPAVFFAKWEMLCPQMPGSIACCSVLLDLCILDLSLALFWFP
jgi:hypothetical protein